MAVVFDTTIDEVAPGQRFQFGHHDGESLIKLEAVTDCRYNAVGEVSGKLCVVPPGTEVVSGYGFGYRFAMR